MLPYVYHFHCLQAEGLLAAIPGHRPGEEECAPPPNPVRDSMSIEMGIVIHHGRGVDYACTEAKNEPLRNGVTVL